MEKKHINQQGIIKSALVLGSININFHRKTFYNQHENRIRETIMITSQTNFDLLTKYFPVASK